MNNATAALLLVSAIATAHADTVEVRIAKMLFTPDVVHVKAGDTVVWKSYEARGYHTVWFAQEGLAESDPLFPEDSWERTFTTRGEFAYYCGPHPWMTGRVIVE